MSEMTDADVLELIGRGPEVDPFEVHNRHIDAENEWLWDFRERLLREVEAIEQRIAAITGIEDFAR